MGIYHDIWRRESCCRPRRPHNQHSGATREDGYHPSSVPSGGRSDPSWRRTNSIHGWSEGSGPGTTEMGSTSDQKREPIAWIAEAGQNPGQRGAGELRSWDQEAGDKSLAERQQLAGPGQRRGRPQVRSGWHPGSPGPGGSLLPKRPLPKRRKVPDGKLRQLEYPKIHIANWSLESLGVPEGPTEHSYHLLERLTKVTTRSFPFSSFENRSRTTCS